MTKRLLDCSFCGGRLDRWGNDDSFSRCIVCGFILRNPLPTEEELDTLYEVAWKDPEANTRETGSMDTQLAPQYVRELFKSLSLTTATGLKILDYGAGRGALLQALEDSGAEVHAVEPYGFEDLIKSGKSAFPSVDALPADLMFDGVVTMDVAEHLARPWDDFESLYERIRPGGWLFVSTPNPAGIKPRLKGSNWHEAKKPGHIAFMDENTLSKMLRKAGFRQFKPLRWYIRYKNGITHRVSQRLLCLLGFHASSRVLAFK